MATKKDTNEYFVIANSFAAPMFSDTTMEYVKGSTPREAMQKFVAEYTHPCGLYAALLYESADAYHKGKKEIVRFLCNQEIERAKLMKNGGSFYGKGNGVFEINGKEYRVKDWNKGKIFEGEMPDA